MPGQRKKLIPTHNSDFEAYYTKIYGKRWQALRESLLEENAALPYSGGNHPDRRLLKPYMLDRASILAAQSLRLPEEGIILDACAAPGGKTLVIASVLKPGLTLLSNELSAERRRRLSKVLDEHLPPEVRERVTVSGFDAAAIGGKKSEHSRFAGILLDAPCSSERHVINSETALSQWKPARPRFLARRQWSLLSSAVLLLRPGGSLVYATCALSPEENDAVVSRLREKYEEAMVPDPPDFVEGEATECGRIILPDVCGGMGPMYVARFRKREL
ncbi:putative methyltransferase nsun4 (Nol1/nop2/sun domainfamily member 4) [Treponema primitia ZAS-2]|uniref:Putative methyltransferase nsun4 (Nol1/nop2/sun domainfamily member 4) n=1 Tax=Treponema primitia (strain ATCC BAA-887 / DSM 12427 / ZAS-2) TaxID=545694 RepID=F5YKJ3_TREPZ|nr:16S rRNA methyltransferase [Treponema primitia]AEF84798.1 putative methyltransferase nsun4 (Nol1/nop2/sun domainfamily member 4) [Treponema primitia ZAS-2]